jgi:hypothetical protein
MPYAARSALGDAEAPDELAERLRRTRRPAVSLSATGAAESSGIDRLAIRTKVELAQGVRTGGPTFLLAAHSRVRFRIHSRQRNVSFWGGNPRFAPAERWSRPRQLSMPGTWPPQRASDCHCVRSSMLWKCRLLPILAMMRNEACLVF